MAVTKTLLTVRLMLQDEMEKGDKLDRANGHTSDILDELDKGGTSSSEVGWRQGLLVARVGHAAGCSPPTSSPKLDGAG